jgi:diaminohydroxyphosphoribosylaminopyrimidine deaminase / 5-amino-6-(5-phosphoribosylamino)uracil reductase
LTEDEKYMKRALDLAEKGRGLVSPNPMVGCVIVKEGKIIGEGWHQKYGGPHAEVNAINDVADKSLLQDATIYVTLEPCAHFGKTPPCADLICQYPIKKVVIANTDPNPLVAGKGIRKIKEAGIEVTTGILEKEAYLLNIRFFTFFNKKRPYIILKWAETSDGFIARKNYDSKWISNEYSRTLVHKWRTEEDAIMVGTKTALYDNPSLNSRDWKGKNPLKIVLDKKLLLTEDNNIFKNERPIVYNALKTHQGELAEYVKIDEGTPLLEFILTDLNSRKIQSVIIEGGSFLLNSFLQCGIWDEARIFKSPLSFGEGIKSPEVDLGHSENIDIFGDKLYTVFNLH